MHVKKKGFLKTLEAVIAGLLLLSYMVWFSAKPVEVRGLEAKNYKLYATLLMASLNSNVSDVLLKADEDSASELLRELSGTEARMRFHLKEIPRKEIWVGYLLEPKNKHNVTLDLSVDETNCSSTSKCTVFGAKSTCAEFRLGSHTLYFVNRTYVAPLNSSDQCDPNLLIPVQGYFDYNGKEYYVFARVIQNSQSNYTLVFLNHTTYQINFYNPHPSLFHRFYLNGKEIYLYFTPVTYDMLTLDLDAIIIVNRTLAQISDDELEAISRFAESGGGILLVNDVDKQYDILNLIGLKWNGSASGPDGSDSVFLDILKKNYVKGYEFVEFFEHAYYPVTMDYLNLSRPGVNVSCISYSGIVFEGNLTVRDKVYPFIVVNDTTSPFYDTVYVSKDGDWDFCDGDNSTPIKEKDVFELEDSSSGVVNNITLEKIPGTLHTGAVYFTFNRNHRFRDMSLAVGTNKNMLIPVKNDTTRIIIHSEMERVGGTFPAPVLILQEINNTYRAGWMTSSLKGDDEWKILRDAVLWVARKVSYAALREQGYTYSVSFPIAWVNETKLMGIAELRIW